MDEGMLAFCDEELDRLEQQGLRRTLRTLQEAQSTVAVIDGRRILLFASNDYLGLANHERIRGAARRAIEQYGVGAGSARLICGHTDLHRALEKSIAAFKSCEDALLFSSGYLANIGTIPVLVGEGDAIFSDALNHASIVDGVRLAKADRFVYAHCDVEELDRLLAEHRRRSPDARRLVITDTVFSMDGDLAPLPKIVDCCRRHSALLMVDEAHATGVVGPDGRGGVAHFGLEGRVPIVMGTLSKALGAAGGFVTGSSRLCEFLRNKARGFIFDTALPPAMVAAASEALQMLHEDTQRGTRLLEQTRSVAARLVAIGYSVGEPDAAIVPVHCGASGKALAFSRRLLEEHGILVPAIRPPTVPEGGARLRLTLSTAHDEDQIAALLHAFESGRVA